MSFKLILLTCQLPVSAFTCCRNIIFTKREDTKNAGVEPTIYITLLSTLLLLVLATASAVVEL